MTVATPINRVEANGDGSTVAFAFGHLFFADADLKVFLTVIATEISTLQFLTTDYTVSGAGNPSGGTVTFVTAPPSTDRVIILRVVSQTQQTNYQNASSFDQEVLEQDQDLAIMAIQQMQEEIDRTFKLDVGSTASAVFPLPSADKLLGWDSLGLALENKTSVPVANLTINGGEGGDLLKINAAETGIESADITPAQATAFLRGFLAGLGTSIGTDTDHDIDIAAGECRSDADDANLVLAATLIKQIDAVWAVGSNAGGLDTGAVAADTGYYLHLIRRSDTGVIDALFSLSRTAPTMPTNYDSSRRIGWVLTDGASNILDFKQYGDYFYWDDPIEDVDVTNQGTTAINYALSVPSGLNILAIINIQILHSGIVRFMYISNPDVNNEAPSADAGPLATLSITEGAADFFAQIEVMTNTSSEIRARGGSSSTELGVATLGWLDRRGRND